MNSNAYGESKCTPKSGRMLLVWDLPTRLFHWLLVTFVLISFVTGAIGGLWMRYHVVSGCVIFGLLIFRLVWGVVGGEYARFSAFVRGPGAVMRYAQTMLRRGTPKHLGHNPLGGWSVLAMLIALLAQAMTGLFANDDIITEGPLYAWVHKATSDFLTGIHMLNQGVLLLLVTVHVAAVFFYLIFKHENLIKPMFTGRKHWCGEGQSAADHLTLAALIASLLGVGLYLWLR